MVFKQPTFFGEPFDPETGDKDASLEKAVANASGCGRRHRCGGCEGDG